MTASASSTRNALALRLLPMRIALWRIVQILAFAAIPVVMLLVNTQLAREFEVSRSLSLEVNRSYRLRAQLQAWHSTHQEIEARQRGFVVTRDPAFLEGHDEARERVGTEYERLSRMAERRPEIAAGLPELAALSQSKIAFAQQAIELSRSGRSEAARNLVASGEGRALMDTIRARIGDMDGVERDRLRRRSALAEAARIRTQRTAYALQTLLVLLLIACGMMIARNMRVRKQAMERFRDLSIRNEAIFDSARDGMLIHDSDGIITSLNPATARMYGYRTDELVGKDVRVLFDIPPSREEIQSFLRRLQTRRQDEIGQVQEFVARRRDGLTFAADVATSPVELAEGPCYLAVIRDVSGRKAVEQMKSDFVSTVSHELRTPLTSIAGSLGLLRGGAAGEFPDRADRLIRIAHDNSERLVRLINDFLDIEKIESGKMPFDVRPVPLGRAIGHSVQANRAFAAGRGVALELEPVDLAAAVLADEDRLAQVIDNLISNAVKFSPEGQVVRLSVSGRRRMHRISVVDRGPGIPEEFRERIFGKFAQADTSDTRQKGGTGLGLAIVREIVIRMGGQVSFDTTIGEGTVFHIDLPAAEPEAEAGRPRGHGRRATDLPRAATAKAGT